MEPTISIEEINEGAYQLYTRSTYKRRFEKLANASMLPCFAIGILLSYLFNLTTKQSGLAGIIMVGILIGTLVFVLLMMVYMKISEIRERKRRKQFMAAPPDAWVQEFLKQLKDEAVQYKDSVEILKETAAQNYEQELIAIDEKKEFLFAKAYEAKRLLNR